MRKHLIDPVGAEKGSVGFRVRVSVGVRARFSVGVRVRVSVGVAVSVSGARVRVGIVGR